ncbi:hypothetical protein RO3G_06134 [Rhizopus delemar RA 99-880]|uniref:Uncharacterized protein n=1 Tax=Rhizopus delemar (strain RA 99-880 / ATCC MYA-4621 / FGSC 9543 / NRRL 43880) TaxID=246409 RepID=I1BYZ9_RHIO9|nr:hypothetical protein RO3G_06134 [Rhizopus delemar RA 99-880]|eukprot:EIE81429.1 hypothetical protein RO3G_06134 [Rhizopus delemar RA 99-880]
MSFRFYYKDGQEKIVDELGNDAMDWEDNVTQFHLTTLTRIRQYCEIQESEQEPDLELNANVEEIANTVKLQRKVYNKYSNEQKLLFAYMNRIKLFNAAKSSRLVGGIAERTAQKWAKRLKEDLSIKRTPVHNFLKTECNISFKKVTLQPVARDNSTKIGNRLAWVKQWTATDMNYLENRVFVDESAFNINMRPSSGWAEKGKPAIVTSPSTKAVSHTILGAISSKFILSMELRNPKRNGPSASRSIFTIAEAKRHLVAKSLCLEVLLRAITLYFLRKLCMRWTIFLR